MSTLQPQGRKRTLATALMPGIAENLVTRRNPVSEMATCQQVHFLKGVNSGAVRW